MGHCKMVTSTLTQVLGQGSLFPPPQEVEFKFLQFATMNEAWFKEEAGTTEADASTKNMASFNHLPDMIIEEGTGGKSAKPFLARARLDSNPRNPPKSDGPYGGCDRIATPLGRHPLVKIFDDVCQDGSQKTLRQKLIAIIWNDQPSGILAVRAGFALQETENFPTIVLALQYGAVATDRAVAIVTEAANHVFQ